MPHKTCRRNLAPLQRERPMALLDWYIRANLKIRHFQALIALEDFRSVSRAAMFLGIKEAQLQKMLNCLESALEAPLFVTNGRGIEPSEHGACLIRHGRQVLNRLLNAQEELRDLQEGRVPRVSLGVSPSVTTGLLPRFIAKLEAEAMPLAVSVREGAISNLLHDLRVGQIDLAISILSHRPLSEDFVHEVLYEEELVLAVRPDHPLARRSLLHWDILEQYPVILSPTGTQIRHYIDNFLREHSIQISRLQLKSSSILTNVGVLQATDSIAFLSKDVAEQFEHAGLLVRLPLRLSGSSMRIGAVWMRERHMAMELKLVHMVLHECIQHMRALPEDTAAPPWQPPVYDAKPLQHHEFW